MHNIHDIGFPDLGIGPIKINSEFINVNGFSVYWYAIFITLGLVCGFLYALSIAKKFDIKKDDCYDAILVGLPACIIGARLFYILFSLEKYNSFWDMLDIRSGGLAIYGAVIFAVPTIILFCKFKKLSAFSVMDVTLSAFFIGQAIGRWGNFTNAECYGSVTNLPWGMTIDGNLPVHPTFLYESLWNTIGFILVFIAIKKGINKYKGEIALFYVAWYGVGRGVIEGLRTDSLMLGGLRISQIIAIVSAAAAIALMVYMRFIKKAAPDAYEEVLSGDGDFDSVRGDDETSGETDDNADFLGQTQIIENISAKIKEDETEK